MLSSDDVSSLLMSCGFIIDMSVFSGSVSIAESVVSGDPDSAGDASIVSSSSSIVFSISSSGNVLLTGDSVGASSVTYRGLISDGVMCVSNSSSFSSKSRISGVSGLVWKTPDHLRSSL